MTMFKLEINMDNAAFQDDDNEGKSETARILREIAAKVEDGSSHGPIRDLNGNKIGEFGMIEMNNPSGVEGFDHGR